MLHKWSRSIAASTTIVAAASMPSGHVTHLTTWREVALYCVNTKDAAGLRRHCTWCARTRIAVYNVTSPVDVGNSSNEQLARLPYSACDPSLNSQTPERWQYRPTRVTRGPHRQRQACPILTTRGTVLTIWVQNEHSFAYLCKNSKHLEHFFGTEKIARFFRMKRAKCSHFLVPNFVTSGGFFRSLNRSRVWRDGGQFIV